MSKISRNAPCPCGSGKKYKHCCLDRHSETNSPPQYMDDSDALDNLSNSIVDLITADQLDEAQKLCHDLIANYPDQIDGLDRMAEVFEARGDKKTAAQYYHKAAAFAQTMPGFDQDSVDWFLAKAKQMELD